MNSQNKEPKESIIQDRIATQRQKPELAAITASWAMEALKVLHVLDTNSDDGLAEHEVAARLRRYGKNLLKITKPRHVVTILVDQFHAVSKSHVGLALAEHFAD